MVLILIRFNGKPGKRKELIQTLIAVVEDVRKENGCLQAEFFQTAGNDENLLLVEEWANRKYFEAHLRSDIFAVLSGAGSLMIEPPTIVVHSVDHSEKLKI